MIVDVCLKFDFPNLPCPKFVVSQELHVGSEVFPQCDGSRPGAIGSTRLYHTWLTSFYSHFGNLCGSMLCLKMHHAFTRQSLKILGSFATVRGLLAPLGKVELLMLGTQYAEWDVACMAQEEGGIGIIRCLLATVSKNKCKTCPCRWRFQNKKSALIRHSSGKMLAHNFWWGRWYLGRASRVGIDTRCRYSPSGRSSQMQELSSPYHK